MSGLQLFVVIIGIPASFLIKCLAWIADDWSTTKRLTIFVLSLLFDVFWYWTFKTEFTY